MPLINLELLRQEGLAEDVIQECVKAVEAAWAEVAPEVQGLGRRPLMSLQLQNPTEDRLTVVVSIGMGARWGATSAKDPAALGEALVRHLRERFAPEDV